MSGRSLRAAMSLMAFLSLTRLSALLGVAALLLVLGSTAQAQGSSTLVSNLGQAPGPVYDYIVTDADTLLAQEFTTGNHQAGYVLANIAVRLLNCNACADSRLLRVRLYNEVGGEPGSEIFTLTNPSNGKGVRTFSAPVVAQRLEANTSYYVFIEWEGSGGGNTAYVVRDTDNDEDGSSVDDWSISNSSKYRETQGDNVWRTRSDGSSILIRIRELNSLPTSADNTVTTAENTDYTFSTVDFPFTDANAGSGTNVGNTLSEVNITELPASGALSLDGVELTAPRMVDSADIGNDKLKYSPPTDTSGDDLALFKFKVNDGQDDSAGAYTMTIDVDSNDATLSGLVLSPDTLNETFAAGITSYTADVSHGVTSVTVTPTTTHDGATVTVAGAAVASGEASGAISLGVGDTAIAVVVTAEDGTTMETYTVTVTRAGSSVATLSGLVLSPDTLNETFAAGTAGYTADVSHGVTSVTVTPTTTHDGATVTVAGAAVASGEASGAISLGVGDTAIAVVVTAEDEVTTRTYTVTVTRAAASTDATLSGLVLSPDTLNETFAAGTTGYTADVSHRVTSVTVTPTTTHDGATVTVAGAAVASGEASGAISLGVGDTAIAVVVTAEDEVTTRTYTVTVTRAAASTDATLLGLVLSTGTLNETFAAGTTNYTDDVSHRVTSVTVTPTTTHAGATVTVAGAAVASGEASGAISLGVGDTTITLEVTAQDGVTTRTYTVTITRAAASTDATLLGLVLSRGVLNETFAAGTTNYTADVSHRVTSVTVTPTTTHAGATVTVKVGDDEVASGAISLGVGDTTITLEVTAQDGVTTRTYTVTVTRAASTDATLLGLVLSRGGVLNETFAAGTTNYTADVSHRVTSVTVTPTTTHAGATVTVKVGDDEVASGAISLGVGDTTITLEVTAQDGVTTRTYTVTVTRAASTVVTLSGLVLSPGALNETFVARTTGYTADVSYGVTSVTVTPTTTHDGATVKVDDTAVASGEASDPISIGVGETAIAVVVTAEDEVTTRTYTVRVTRAAASTDATLSGLVLSPGALNETFAAGTTGYTADVSPDMTSVMVTPTTTHDGATVTVDGTAVASGEASDPISIDVGDTTITLEVTAEDEVTTRTYTVTVTRAAAIDTVAVRIDRVTKEILPRVAQTMAASTLSVITGRIDSVVSGAAAGGSLSLAGQTSLYQALESNAWALNDDTLSLAEVLGSSSFVLPLNAAGEGGTADGENSGSIPGRSALWGSGDYRKISDDRDSSIDWDGDIFSFHLGADMRVLPDLLVGFAMSRSLGSFDYTDRTSTVQEGGLAADGRYETRMTGAHAYVHRSLSEDLGLWATVDYGQGGIEIDDEAAGSKESSDTEIWTAALGTSGALISDDEIIAGGETTLKLKGDVSLARISVAGGERIDALTLGTSRLRVVLEASHERRLDSGGRLTPSVEAGLRLDGGDGLTGNGLELGGALRFVDPAIGLTVEGRGRMVLADGSDYREWGLGGLVRLDPGAAKLGLSFSLAPGWGDAASGTARLWDRGMTGTDASDGNVAQMRLDSELGYGFSTLGGRGSLTPYGGFSMTGGGVQNSRIGGRFELGSSFDLSLEGERREAANDAAADHGVMLRMQVHW